MKTRNAIPPDIEGILEVHRRAVRELCCDHYSPEQIEAWVGSKSSDHYRKRIEAGHFYVAEVDGKVAGYSRFNPGSGELSSVFVNPDYAGRGIGTALMERALEDAAGLDMTHIWIDASLNSIPFYESSGFLIEKETTHSFKGVSLECMRMIKRIP